uniref:Uncharacterized protein n=1 Tax=Arundo donax TaxID=35708 RepID=A0A0A8ZVJ0_ARUDO
MVLLPSQNAWGLNFILKCKYS